MMNKYALYEASVQSPETHLEWVADWFEKIHGKRPLHLREDFCGTFKLCCEWVKLSPSHSAVGFDIDLDPLTYGAKHHLKKLSDEEKKRIWIQQQDVLHPTALKSDLILACNFSFCIFHERAKLLTYFKRAYQSLNTLGSLVLELAGGPGMLETLREKRKFSIGKKKFTYIWHQKDFDPLHNRGQFAIHFVLPSGEKLTNAFTYDWRLWTIPEIKELLKEAGFQDYVIYWETSHKGKGTGEYLPATTGDNAHAWITYIVANKKLSWH
jgi:hypothetical protein